MNRLTAWPAFGKAFSLQDSVSSSLLYQRGVFGKVHQASSDFRWIAQSPGFDSQRTPERQLNIGSEDIPDKIPFWRAHGEICYAVSSYPSRAMDRAGRSNFLEKQVIEWCRPAQCPAVIGALLLLPLVVRFKDNIWWHHAEDQPWEDASFSLPILPKDLPPIPVTEQALQEAVENALHVLRQELQNQDALRDLFTLLISGHSPAALQGVSKPLSAPTIAALLLPLERDLADRISLAGWLPSQRYSPGLWSDRWSVIAMPPAADPLTKTMPLLPEPRHQELAERMATALWNGNPAILQPHPTQQPVSLTLPQKNTFQDSIPLAAKIKRLPPLPLRPDALLPLMPPRENCNQDVHFFYEFARHPHRRWIDSNLACTALSWSCEDPADPTSLYCHLRTWVHEVTRLIPGGVSRKQWDIKLDLMRAAALAVNPSISTDIEISFPMSGWVPPLYFVPGLKTLKGIESLARNNFKCFDRILRQSLTPRHMIPHELRLWIIQWMQQTEDWTLKCHLDWRLEAIVSKDSSYQI